MSDREPEPSSAYAAQLRDTVFIVDDDPLVRSALEITLTLAGLKAVKFASAQQFLAHVTAEHSGCVLTDIRMPGMDGHELQEELARRNVSMSVLVMTGYADVPLAVRALKAGALDILEKPFKNELLVEKVRAALALAREKSEQSSQRDSIAARYESLSQRERDVLKLVFTGKSSKEIGRDLNISPRTVDVHRSNLMEKMRAESLTALVRMTGMIL